METNPLLQSDDFLSPDQTIHELINSIKSTNIKKKELAGRSLVNKGKITKSLNKLKNLIIALYNFINEKFELLNEKICELDNKFNQKVQVQNTRLDNLELMHEENIKLNKQLELLIANAILVCEENIKLRSLLTEQNQRLDKLERNNESKEVTSITAESQKNSPIQRKKSQELQKSNKAFDIESFDANLTTIWNENLVNKLRDEFTIFTKEASEKNAKLAKNLGKLEANFTLEEEKTSAIRRKILELEKIMNDLIDNIANLKKSDVAFTKSNAEQRELFDVVVSLNNKLQEELESMIKNDNPSAMNFITGAIGSLKTFNSK